MYLIKSDQSVLDSTSDKVPLAATVDKELEKDRRHRANLNKYGYGYMPFEFAPFAFESSGALSKAGIKFFKEICAEYEGENYIREGKEYTWSAFTLQQMLPQKLSFAVHYWTAKAAMRGLSLSRPTVNSA